MNQHGTGCERGAKSMAGGRKKSDQPCVRERAAAIGSAAREQQLISMAMDRAEIIKKKLKEEFNIEPQIFWIGPIVGTTCGPGIIATYCFGKEVTYFETSEQ